MSQLHQLPFEQPIFDLERQIAEVERSAGADAEISRELAVMRDQLATLTAKTYGRLTPWQTVLVARHPNRPQYADYLDLVYDDFAELHGDKAFGDDRALIAGFAKIDDFRVVVVGHQKGRNLKERSLTYFGCAHPEGYRKALVKMKLAEKYRLPVVCFIDTPGAYPGIGAEERGQAQMIATNLMEMARLKVPVVCVVIGEGGSGGALGIGVGNRVCMMQFAYYSVISPEGCSGILWKDADANKEDAASALRLTSGDLLRLGVVDDVVEEPLGGAHRDPRRAAMNLKGQIVAYLRELAGMDAQALTDQRHGKFRAMGQFDLAG